MKFHAVRDCLVATLAIAQYSGAHAQDQGAEAVRDFPARPVRIVVPFPSGGGNDIMGRFMAARR